MKKSTWKKFKGAFALYKKLENEIEQTCANRMDDLFSEYMLNSSEEDDEKIIEEIVESLEINLKYNLSVRNVPG